MGVHIGAICGNCQVTLGSYVGGQGVVLTTPARKRPRNFTAH